MALIYNAAFDKNTRKLSFEDKAGNEIYSFTVPERTPVDDVTKPLTFKATQDGSTVTLTRTGYPIGDFQTSRDGGNTWEDYKIDTVITLNTGDEVSFRAKADRTSEQKNQSYFYFEMKGKIEAWHNVMSLYRTNDFATYDTAIRSAFYKLFYRCTSLTKAPALPATTLDIECYNYMFSGCTSLTKSPNLSATTLGSYCYNDMFSGCSSLNEVRCKVPSSYSRYDTQYWLNNVASTGTFYTNADANWTTGVDGIPEGWRRVNEVAKDDLSKPLTFKATQDDSTVTLKKRGSPTGDFQTSRDGGNTWTDYTIDTAITLNTGDEVSFRAKSDRTSAQSDQSYFYFTMTGKIEAWHNVMSLHRTNDFATYNTVESYAFTDLFRGCSSLTKAPVLPATTLAQHCYYWTFARCTSLIKAPELPATTLALSCYECMFNGCQSLKEVRISATKTATNALYNWLSGVSATGDFYCDPNATIFPTDSASGIPKGWTRKPLSDYPVTP